MPKLDRTQPVITILTNYLNDQLTAQPPLVTSGTGLLKYGLILIGMAWGVPWIWASMSAAAALFPASWAGVMGVVFAVGIVVTVGADGWWIMQTACERLHKRSPAQLQLKGLQHTNAAGRYLNSFACVLLATLACIAPVYASVKYTSGTQQLLALITLVGYYGYGLVGYSRLLDRGRQWWHARRSPELAGYQQQLVQRIANIQDSTVANWQPRSWASWLLQDESVDSLKRCHHSPLQLIGIALIPPAAALVDIFLISEFIQRSIWANPVFVFAAAVIAALPAFAVNVLATYHVLGNLTKPKTRPVLSAAWQKTSLILPTLGALVAPSAAAYITYTTLSAHHLPGSWILCAVLAISVARMLFSWFTLHRLLEQLHSRFSTNKAANLLLKIQNAAEAVARIHPSYLQGLSARSVNNVS